MAACSNCNAQLEDGAKFCDSCGAEQEQTLFCENCGQKLESGVTFCDSCGTPVSAKAELMKNAAEKIENEAQTQAAKQKAKAEVDAFQKTFTQEIMEQAKAEADKIIASAKTSADTIKAAAQEEKKTMIIYHFDTSRGLTGHSITGIEGAYDGTPIQVKSTMIGYNLSVNGEIMAKYSGDYQPKKTLILKVENYPFKSGPKTIEVFVQHLTSAQIMLCIGGKFVGGAEI